MKIEIDTLRDSKEDIKKIIKMLMHLIEDHAAFDIGFAKTNNTEGKEDPYSSENSSLNLGFLDSPPPEENKEEDPKVDFSSIIEY
ncbi:hypothetical protein KY335_03620 [Candidatus Woesearchaeota archaeon]|nr:hypothetical protein [Candidatus Woesearchaeota archaeon]MBW3014305.1 hypothetical protein [Candidatus Woesearchaeota archaeon]